MSAVMNIIALPALTDNYIWLLHNGQQAVVVDPGEAAPVIDALHQYNLQLSAILVTHHHADHVEGIKALRVYLQRGHSGGDGKVWGPATEDIAQPYEGLKEGCTLRLLGMDITVLDVPGHTAGHIAYYVPAQPGVDGAKGLKGLAEPVVFTGDTLFSAGCGRLFEGTAKQMEVSLAKLAALPAATRVYCAHEYTLSNLEFAHAVEPDNDAVMAYMAHCRQLRGQNIPTLPSTIAQELLINPFLRTQKPAIINAVRAHAAKTGSDGLPVFAALRSWKDVF